MSPTCTAIHRAWTHIVTWTIVDANATWREFLTILADPQVLAAEAEMTLMMRADDVQGTWHALEQWQGTYMRALARIRTEAP